ncbi:DUF397 domain-containing protein [Actinomadura flavalba]|uniref:DUF397 domain-containing protein n=1 Tax=Actinomadura flavalba TaxID=1120938 RepID=UPI00036F7609|nr:DUF397 domain-containing protein [Actinomadura flavalba]
MELSDNLTWRKSRRSGPEGNACIELASAPGTVALRDSKDPDGPKLLVDRADYHRFTDAIRAL